MDGKQPTHCCDHGRLEKGVVHTVRTDRNKGSCRASYSCAVKYASYDITTECLF